MNRGRAKLSAMMPRCGATAIRIRFAASAAEWMNCTWDALTEVARKLVPDLEFAVECEQLILYGICKECQEK